LATVACGIITRKLDPSVEGTGPHGLTVRIDIARPRLPLRPSHPASRVVTIGRTSLVSRRDDASKPQLTNFGKTNIFGNGGGLGGQNRRRVFGLPDVERDAPLATRTR